MYWHSLPDWQDGRSVAEVAAALEPFGIVLTEPAGSPHYKFDDARRALTKEIGAVAVHRNGRIKAVPHYDISQCEVIALLADAHHAFENKPSVRRGWTKRWKDGQQYWRANVMLRCRPDHPAALAIAATNEGFRQESIRLTSRLEPEVIA